MGLLEVVDPVLHCTDGEPGPVPRATAADTLEGRACRRQKAASPDEANIRRRERIPAELPDGAANSHRHVELGARRGRRLGP